MSSVNAASATAPVLPDSSAPARQPGAQEANTELQRLLVAANDTSIGSVAQAQALADADALLGGRVESFPSSVDGGYTLASGTQTVASAKPVRLDTFVGKDTWSERQQGMVTQLNYESRLQAAGAPDYSAALAGSAKRLGSNASLFQTGTYRAASPPSIVGSGTRVANPLAIDKISAANSRATVQRLDTEIRNINTEIARLRQENTRLSQQNFASFDPRRAVAAAQVAANNANMTRLQGQNIANSLSRDKAINDARLQDSRFENGRLYRAVATGVDPNKAPVIFINGVNTDQNRSAMEAMELSKLLNVPVDHIVNVSSKDKLVNAGAGIISGTSATQLITGIITRNPGNVDPNVADQRVQQLLTGNNEAAATAANSIYDQLMNTNGKVKVVGYSQGAAIGTEALRKVNDILTQKGYSEADRTKLLGRVEFLGIGPGAAERHVSQAYQSGLFGGRVRDVRPLQAVNYKTISDANDPISRLLNVSNPDGSRTNGTDLGQARGAIQQLTTGKGILPHLSYFKGYEATDPGSIYNSQVGTAIHQWFAGTGARNVIVYGANTGQ
jgi:hypothetical protein